MFPTRHRPKEKEQQHLKSINVLFLIFFIFKDLFLSFHSISLGCIDSSRFMWPIICFHPDRFQVGETMPVEAAQDLETQ